MLLFGIGHMVARCVYTHRNLVTTGSVLCLLDLFTDILELFFVPSGLIVRSIILSFPFEFFLNEYFLPFSESMMSSTIGLYGAPD